MRSEISRDGWDDFLIAFGRQHRAWLATVERSVYGEHEVEAVEQPLADIETEHTGGAVVSAIHILLGPHSAPRVEFRIAQPIAVRVERTQTGADSALEIDDDGGGRTRVTFRAAAVPEMVDGVAPGEL